MFEVVFHHKFWIKNHTQNMNTRLFIGSVLEHWVWKLLDKTLMCLIKAMQVG